jgi:branched-chain amino acid aminotransferase
MTLAQDAGMPVIEKRITRDEMYIADEAFFTGTASELTPVVAVDNRTVGNGTPGPITTKLQQEYFEAARGGHSRSAEWLTYVRP